MPNPILAKYGIKEIDRPTIFGIPLPKKEEFERTLEFGQKIPEPAKRLIKAPIAPPPVSSKTTEKIFERAYIPVRWIEKEVKEGLKALPPEVRDILIPTITPKELPSIREIEQEYIQDPLLQRIASAPVDPVVLGTMGAQIAPRPFGFRMPTTLPTNLNKLSNEELWTNFSGNIGQLKTKLSSARWDNFFKWYDTNILSRTHFRFGGLLTQQRGAIRIPSGKEIAELTHRFQLTPQQAKAVSRGIYTGLSREVTKAIREYTGPPAPSAERILGKLPKEKITIGESTALKRLLTRQQQVARHAEIETKKRQREITSLTKKIKKAPIVNMHAEERIAISILLKQLPKMRTLEDLRNFYNRISLLKEAGKRRYIETKDAEDAKFGLDKMILLKTANITPAVIEPKGLKAGKPTPKTEMYKTARAITLRPTRILDALDGGQNFQGPYHNYFYKRVNEAEDIKLRTIEARQNNFESKMQQIGITSNDLAKTRKIGLYEFTVDEMVSIYVAAKNKEKALAVVYGNKIPFALMREVIIQMTPQEKALGDALIEEYKSNYLKVRKALLDYTNGKTDLGVAINYTPIRRTLQGFVPTEEELIKEMMERMDLRKAYPQRGFTKERLKHISPQFQQPIRLGETAIWYEQMEKQEHFVTHGRLIKELQRMVHDKDFANSVRNKLGQSYLTALENWVNRVANPNIYKAYTQFEKTISALRQNAAIAYLGINLLTIGKQFPSLFLLLEDITPQDLLSGIYELSTDFTNKMNLIDELAPQIKFRSLERELEEFKVKEPNKWRMMMKKFGSKAMQGIMEMDKYVVHAGWLSVFNARKADGLSDTEAASQATMSILRTQPAAKAKDIADLYAMGEVTNIFTQFTNQLNQIYNIVTYDIPAQARTERYGQGIRSAIGVAMSAALIALITAGRLPKNLKEAGDWTIEQILSWIPMFGRGITSVMKGYDFTSIPAFSGFEKAARSLNYFRKGEFGKATLAAGEAGAVIGGLPFAQPRRIFRGIRSLIRGEGAREFLWRPERTKGGNPILEKYGITTKKGKNPILIKYGIK